MAAISNRLFSSIKQSLIRNPNRNLHPRLLSSLPSPDPDPNPNPLPHPRRTQTPMETSFTSWISTLRPGFTPADVDAALRSIPDPDLAFDVFRWCALRPGFRHDAATYHTLLLLTVSSRRLSHAEALVHEILSGAAGPAPDLPLFNSAIRFCCSQRHLFSLAFDLFKRLQQPRPSATVETYSMLLAAILRRFSKPPVSYVYLRAVRSLVKQMKASGVIPDTLTLNLIIKAFSRCLEMDEAIRIFKEMGLYACEPNEYSYGYIAKGLCEKGRTEEGFRYFKEMREKGLVPTSTVYSGMVCCLAMERRFEEAVKVMFDMLEKGRRPDILTYRTLLEEMCRDGRADDAFELLEELGDQPGVVSKRMYDDLLDGLHWLCQPQD